MVKVPFTKTDGATHSAPPSFSWQGVSQAATWALGLFFAFGAGEYQGRKNAEQKNQPANHNVLSELAAPVETEVGREINGLREQVRELRKEVGTLHGAYSKISGKCLLGVEEEEVNIDSGNIDPAPWPNTEGDQVQEVHPPPTSRGGQQTPDPRGKPDTERHEEEVLRSLPTAGQDKSAPVIRK